MITKEEWENKRLEDPALPSWENKKLIEETLMSKDFNEANIVMSFINGQPGLVIRGETGEELDKNMDQALGRFKIFKEAIEEKAVESGLTAKCKTCQAVMVKRSGTIKSGEKAGQPWNALMCPNSEKGKPGHEPVWL